METFIQQLKDYFIAINRDKPLQLIAKAQNKIDSSSDYAEQFKRYIDNGSTFECRELFSCFGGYWKGCDHQSLVDSIDTAVMHIKDGTVQEGIDFFNLLHN